MLKKKYLNESQFSVKYCEVPNLNMMLGKLTLVQRGAVVFHCSPVLIPMFRLLWM